MSGVKGVKHADHRLAADQARQIPGLWVLAATYNSSNSAKSAARAIRRGDEVLRFYGPAGAFDTRTELTQDGADLFVKYLVDQTEGAPA
ncbi:hypothetical protein LZP81_31040 [Streptomyces parvulus]|uniref:hypothetical protein n=1 Tax=Streptomyces parvulus TaxID=146923 RepID=UPI001E3D0E37|nr:hypothetical protein [Streptomyces parvulus]MCC9154860.1 hypothetical protein [Streptomyces parvulus]MCE7691295.1 hypothetical protein [Streptomyces parvulus]